MKCIYCESTEEELRPYGPNGSMVCFPCAMSTKERQEEAKYMFLTQLAACGEGAIIGTEAGPIPATRKNLQ